MTTKTLYFVNGALALAVGAGLLAYLFSGEPATVTPNVSQSAVVMRQKVEGAAAPRISHDMEPSERVLSNAELERQSQNDAQLVGQSAAEQVTVSLPLAALEPDAEMGLDATQLATVQALRQAFSDAMRDAGDPSSAQYLEQWTAAQSQLDEYLQIYLGDEVFLKFNQRAVMARAAAEPSGK